MNWSWIKSTQNNKYNIDELSNSELEQWFTVRRIESVPDKSVIFYAECVSMLSENRPSYWDLMRRNSFSNKMHSFATDNCNSQKKTKCK